MRLGETLPQWNSKEKKCCLYETPYVAAPMRVLGDVIAKAMPYKQIPLDAPTRTRKFSWFTSDKFSRDPSCHIETPASNFYKEIYEKVVPERTTYCAWEVPWWVPSSILPRILCSDLASWAKTLRTPEIKMLEERYQQAPPCDLTSLIITPL